MSLSIRYKAGVPVLALALVIGALCAVALFALLQIDRINESLVDRFTEIEDVRQIEVMVGNLVYPHADYATRYNLAARDQARAMLAAIEERLRRLREMSSVNSEEREMLEFVQEKLDAVGELSRQVFAYDTSQEEGHHSAMELMHELSAVQLSALSERLHSWHKDELRQVDALKKEADDQTHMFILWVAVLVTATVAVLGFTIWLNNAMLLRPIISISESASVLAAGNLKQKVQVFSNDEIGTLAKDINRMATALDGFYDRLDKLAHTDPLTGLRNRHAFDEIIAQRISAARRYEEAFSVVMLDVDRFKRVNDTYGHSVGDAVLKHVAAVCQQTLRDCDYSFRLGGEEFLLMLPNTTLENALRAAERCREALAGSSVVAEGHTVTVTASFGTASFPDCGQTKEDLVRVADAALYRAKEAGRNRVERGVAGEAKV